MFNKKYVFFLFSSNHNSFSKFLFMTVVAFYLINYTANKETVLLLEKKKKTNHESENLINNIFLFHSFIQCFFFNIIK